MFTRLATNKIKKSPDDTGEFNAKIASTKDALYKNADGIYNVVGSCRIYNGMSCDYNISGKELDGCVREVSERDPNIYIFDVAEGKGDYENLTSRYYSQYTVSNMKSDAKILGVLNEGIYVPWQVIHSLDDIKTFVGLQKLSTLMARR